MSFRIFNTEPYSHFYDLLYELGESYYIYWDVKTKTLKFRGFWTEEENDGDEVTTRYLLANFLDQAECIISESSVFDKIIDFLPNLKKVSFVKTEITNKIFTKLVYNDVEMQDYTYRIIPDDRDVITRKLPQYQDAFHDWKNFCDAGGNPVDYWLTIENNRLVRHMSQEYSGKKI